MANDRIYLRCMRCDNRILLGKYYPSVIPKADARNGAEIKTFIGHHLHKCYGMDCGEDLGPDPLFIIGGENTL